MSVTANLSVTTRRNERQPRLFRTALLYFVCGIVGFFFAACGGAAGPGVASIGSSTTTTSPGATAQSTTNAATYADAVKYSQCMRTHGVPNMPDPTSNGSFISDRGKLNGENINQNSPQFASANKACEHLLPNNGQLTRAQMQQITAQLLRYAECMRSHGISKFPDPISSADGAGFNPHGLDLNSSAYKVANNACKSLSPSGVGVG